ncbi:MAG: hypothetical protein J0I06_25915 [Planctomycetes bacterium]|nr:hypothetical protein [Planctomycetota bacterium]
MAIEFNCPHCQHQYKLKDELAGKTATCKTCRKKITIPQPVTVPDDAPALDAAAAEAAALAALADEPAKVEQDAASQVLNVECQYCNHKWTEPLTRAGKNTLCPNPECRQRVKIPEPKKEDILDWRQMRTKGPSLAKENQQKLDGVQDAADVKQLSSETVREHILEDDVEPRPLKQKVLFGLLAVGLVVGLVFGVMYLTRTRTTKREDGLLEDAQKEFVGSVEGLPKDEAPVYAALMHMAAGEHAVRHDETPKFKHGMDQLAKAREALRPPPHTPARNAAVAELAVATLVMGGTEEQAREQIRLRWLPDSQLRTRPNERVFTIYEELNKTLDLLQTADMEFRTHLARRLTRELMKRGQTVMADQLIPRALFSQSEQPEGRAVVALEIYRADKGSDLPKKAADELRARGAELLTPGTPPPASVQTLFLVLKTDRAPLVAPPPAGSSPSDHSRYAYVGFHLLEDRAPDALKIAQMPGRPETQLRCLALYADWAADPGPALDAAWGVISANAGKKEATIPPSSVLRLVQIAAAAGKHDQATQFADKLADDGLKAWAKGDAVRLRLAAAPKERGADTWIELPDDAKKLRAGHALGRLWLARHNTRLSGDRAAEVKAASAWPAPISSFGKAGVALGLQDREK